MDFKGLVIATEYVKIDGGINTNDPYSVEHRHVINDNESLISSEIEVFLVNIAEPGLRYPIIKTKMNFWINGESNQTAIAERILYSAKNQYAEIFFILYQIMSEHNLKHIHIHPVSDSEVYQNVKSQIPIGDLTFDNLGRYNFPF